MKSFLRMILVAPLVAGTLGACYVSARPVEPAPMYEPVPGPRAGMVWIGGHWRWNGGRYIWIRGHWRVA